MFDFVAVGVADASHARDRSAAKLAPCPYARCSEVLVNQAQRFTRNAKLSGRPRIRNSIQRYTIVEVILVHADSRYRSDSFSDPILHLCPLQRQGPFPIDFRDWLAPVTAPRRHEP